MSERLVPTTSKRRHQPLRWLLTWHKKISATSTLLAQTLWSVTHLFLIGVPGNDSAPCVDLLSVLPLGKRLDDLLLQTISYLGHRRPLRIGRKVCIWAH